MRKLLISGLLATCILSGSVFANAATSDVTHGFVAVSATSSAELDPNQAVVTFSVEANKKELSEVSGELNTISAKLTEALKAKLSDKDSIKTSVYSIVPVYYQKDKKRILTGYKATTKMTVTTKNIQELSNIISTALNNGAISVTGLNFLNTDYQVKCNELVSAASKKAYNDAVAITKSVNSNIEGVKQINSTCGIQTAPYVQNNVLKTAGAHTDSASSSNTKITTPSIEPGTIHLNANVDASFYVK